MPDDTTLAGALQPSGGAPPNSSTGQLDLSVHPSDIDQTAVKPITADDVAQATHGAIKGTPTPSSTDDSTVKDLYAREAQDRLGLSFTPDLNDPKMVSCHSERAQYASERNTRLVCSRPTNRHRCHSTVGNSSSSYHATRSATSCHSNATTSGATTSSWRATQRSANSTNY